MTKKEPFYNGLHNFHISKVFKFRLPNPTNVHPSVEGYEAIAHKIIPKIR